MTLQHSTISSNSLLPLTIASCNPQPSQPNSVESSDSISENAGVANWRHYQLAYWSCVIWAWETTDHDQRRIGESDLLVTRIGLPSILGTLLVSCLWWLKRVVRCSFPFGGRWLCYVRFYHFVAFGFLGVIWNCMSRRFGFVRRVDSRWLVELSDSCASWWIRLGVIDYLIIIDLDIPWKLPFSYRNVVYMCYM